MRKLSLLTCLLVGVLANSWAMTTGISALTYSVEANSFPTDFGNNFSYYHVNLDLGEFTRVANNGKVKVTIDFQSGMEVKETRFEKKPNGAIYYVTDFVTPLYKATVTDLSGNILMENTYGGFDNMMEFGKERSYSESDLAQKWLNDKDQLLQRIEFQNLDFTDLENDLIQVLETTPIVIPEIQKAQPKRPDKVKLPSVDAGAPIESKAAETINDKGEIVEEGEGKTNEETSINQAAAAEEEAILKDPFGELKQPLQDDELAKRGQTAPPAPKDYEANAQRAKEKKSKKTKKSRTESEESITPALSDRQNIVKLNLPNLTFGNFTLNYERLLSARNSVALNLGYIRPQKPTDFLTDFVDADEVDPAEFSGVTATAEYRIYSKKKGAGRGFYLAPYARYANHKLTFNSDIDGNFTRAATQLSAVGLGGQIGIQWLIKDRIVVDWGILGLSATWYNFKSTFTAVEEEINFDEIRAELEAEIDDSILSNKLEFTSSENALEAKMPFLFGGARTYLSIGYKF